MAVKRRPEAETQSETTDHKIRHNKRNTMQPRYYKQKQTANADYLNSLTRQQISYQDA
jgi:hypothetical protein